MNNGICGHCGQPVCPCCGQAIARPIEIDAIVQGWLAFEGMTMADLKRIDKRAHVVELRRKVAEYLHAQDWSLVKIGQFLDRDHTTILALLKPKARRD